MMSEDLNFYTGAGEDVYAAVRNFMVGGVPADATTYTAKLAMIGDSDVVMEADWQDAAWVDDAPVPTATAFFEFSDVGMFWLYLLLEGPTDAPREQLPVQVCRVRVKATP
jgi:hypothetical protein